MAEAVKPPIKGDPGVAAILFSHATHSDGGATLDLSKNKVIESGTEAYMVGGEPNREGVRIPTQVADKVSPLSAVQMMEHVRAQTRGVEGSSVGSWKNAEGKYEVDASRAYPSVPSAMSMARTRNEKAIWDMKRMEEIPNPDYDPNKPQV
jgi:hypothetical protein